MIILHIVLIVAKCIVNFSGENAKNENLFVLIVAKCIVNKLMLDYCDNVKYVLIVAKCIVNTFNNFCFLSINKY